ncbi:hypothetical protein WG66_005461 [Moniliophthora roreri]|nr:hypothetical protein WG66_005461 [Moniliophthora roreri]
MELPVEICILALLVFAVVRGMFWYRDRQPPNLTWKTLSNTRISHTSNPSSHQGFMMKPPLVVDIHWNVYEGVSEVKRHVMLEHLRIAV